MDLDDRYQKESMIKLVPVKVFGYDQSSDSPMCMPDQDTLVFTCSDCLIIQDLRTKSQRILNAGLTRREKIVKIICSRQQPRTSADQSYRNYNQHGFWVTQRNTLFNQFSLVILTTCSALIYNSIDQGIRRVYHTQQQVILDACIVSKRSRLLLLYASGGAYGIACIEPNQPNSNWSQDPDSTINNLQGSVVFRFNSSYKYQRFTEQSHTSSSNIYSFSSQKVFSIRIQSNPPNLIQKQMFQLNNDNIVGVRPLQYISADALLLLTTKGVLYILNTGNAGNQVCNQFRLFDLCPGVFSDFQPCCMGSYGLTLAIGYKNKILISLIQIKENSSASALRTIKLQDSLQAKDTRNRKGVHQISFCSKSVIVVSVKTQANWFPQVVHLDNYDRELDCFKGGIYSKAKQLLNIPISGLAMCPYQKVLLVLAGYTVRALSTESVKSTQNNQLVIWQTKFKSKPCYIEMHPSNFQVLVQFSVLVKTYYFSINGMLPTGFSHACEKESLVTYDHTGRLLMVYTQPKLRVLCAYSFDLLCEVFCTLTRFIQVKTNPSQQILAVLQDQKQAPISTLRVAHCPLLIKLVQKLTPQHINTAVASKKLEVTFAGTPKGQILCLVFDDQAKKMSIQFRLNFCSEEITQLGISYDSHHLFVGTATGALFVCQAFRTVIGQQTNQRLSDKKNFFDNSETLYSLNYFTCYSETEELRFEQECMEDEKQRINAKAETELAEIQVELRTSVAQMRRSQELEMSSISRNHKQKQTKLMQQIKQMQSKIFQIQQRHTSTKSGLLSAHRKQLVPINKRKLELERQTNSLKQKYSKQVEQLVEIQKRRLSQLESNFETEIDLLQRKCRLEQQVMAGTQLQSLISPGQTSGDLLKQLQHFTETFEAELVNGGRLRNQNKQLSEKLKPATRLAIEERIKAIKQLENDLKQSQKQNQEQLKAKQDMEDSIRDRDSYLRHFFKGIKGYTKTEVEIETVLSVYQARFQELRSQIKQKNIEFEESEQAKANGFQRLDTEKTKGMNLKGKIQTLLAKLADLKQQQNSHQSSVAGSRYRFLTLQTKLTLWVQKALKGQLGIPELQNIITDDKFSLSQTNFSQFGGAGGKRSKSFNRQWFDSTLMVKSKQVNVESSNLLSYANHLRTEFRNLEKKRNHLIQKLRVLVISREPILSKLSAAKQTESAAQLSESNSDWRGNRSRSINSSESKSLARIRKNIDQIQLRRSQSTSHFAPIGSNNLLTKNNIVNQHGRIKFRPRSLSQLGTNLNNRLSLHSKVNKPETSKQIFVSKYCIVPLNRRANILKL